MILDKELLTLSHLDKISADISQYIDNTYATKTELNEKADKNFLSSFVADENGVTLYSGAGNSCVITTSGVSSNITSKFNPHLAIDDSVTVNQTASLIAKYEGDGTLSATSADSDIAYVTISDKTLRISGESIGTTTITANLSETSYYNSDTVTFKANVVEENESTSIGSISLSANKTSFTIQSGESDTVTCTAYVNSTRPVTLTFSINPTTLNWITLNSETGIPNTAIITFAPPSDMASGSYAIYVTATISYKQWRSFSNVHIKANIIAKKEEDEPEPVEEVS